MEQAKDIPSLDSIHVDSFIWSDTSEHRESEKANSASIQIATVSKVIRNPLILAHIKPDYGSLSEFMTDIGVAKDLLTFKKYLEAQCRKKPEVQDDSEEKRVRLGLKNRDLVQVLRSQAATAAERAVASKIIIEDLFQKNFGVSLSSLSSQSNQTQSSLQRRFNSSALQQQLDEAISVRPKEDQVSSAGRNDLVVKQKSDMQSRITLQPHHTLVLGHKEKVGLISSLKNNYRLLQKYEVNAGLAQDREDYYSEIRRSEGEMTKPAGQDHCLQFQNCQLEFQELVSVLKDTQLEKVEELRMIRVKCSSDLLCFLLDLLAKVGYCLKTVSLTHLPLPETERVSLKLQQLLEKCNVKYLEANSLGLNTKDFGKICLGVGMRGSLLKMCLRDNKIDRNGLKCLQVLLRFSKDLQVDLRGNPIERQLTKEDDGPKSR